MTCRYCGNEIDSAHRYCPHCGADTHDGYVDNSDSVRPNSVDGRNDEVRCPNCGSANIHFVTKPGGPNVDAGNACCGYMLFGPLGLLCGVNNTESKTVRKCMSCGHEF